MDRGDFIIMLARQRSGTNPLRSVLGTHPEIYCLPEVFNNRPSQDYVIGLEANYASFLAKRFGDDVRGVLTVADHERLFVDFLEYLRCFSDRRFLLVDVKYNSAHQVGKYWHFITEEPFLFCFIREHGLRVLNLTRRNFLRYYLSEVKAQITQRWEDFDEAVVGDRPWYRRKYAGRAVAEDPRIAVDVEDMLKTLELCRSENDVVAASFEHYERSLTIDYEDLFARIGAPVVDSALERIAAWLGVQATFAERRPQYRKQSAAGLRDTISNYDEVAAALCGTPFEYCLEDEALYRAAAEPVAAG